MTSVDAAISHLDCRRESGLKSRIIHRVTSTMMERLTYSGMATAEM